MLDDQDIVKLKSVFATKEDIQGFKVELKQDINSLRGDFTEFKQETNSNFLRLDGDVGSIKTDMQEVKSDMADLKELVQGLIVSTDGIAKSIGELRLEYAAITTQLSRHELWIKQIAEKVGLKLATD